MLQKEISLKVLLLLYHKKCHCLVLMVHFSSLLNSHQIFSLIIITIILLHKMPLKLFLSSILAISPHQQLPLFLPNLNLKLKLKKLNKNQLNNQKKKRNKRSSKNKILSIKLKLNFNLLLHPSFRNPNLLKNRNLL